MGILNSTPRTPFKSLEQRVKSVVQGAALTYGNLNETAEGVFPNWNHNKLCRVMHFGALDVKGEMYLVVPTAAFVKVTKFYDNLVAVQQLWPPLDEQKNPNLETYFERSNCIILQNSECVVDLEFVSDGYPLDPSTLVTTADNQTQQLGLMDEYLQGIVNWVVKQNG